MEVLAAILGVLIWILRIAVPIYLYREAEQIQLPKPAWWILFGLFQPIGALIAYYAITFVRDEIRRAVQQS
jgi:zinc transporter ZupT